MNVQNYVDTSTENATDAVYQARSNYFDARRHREEIQPHLSLTVEMTTGRFVLLTDIKTGDVTLLRVLLDGLGASVKTISIAYVRHNKTERQMISRETLCEWLDNDNPINPDDISSEQTDLFASFMTLLHNQTSWVVRRVSDDTRVACLTKKDVHYAHVEFHSAHQGPEELKITTTAYTVDRTDLTVQPVGVAVETTYTPYDVS